MINIKYLILLYCTRDDNEEGFDFNIKNEEKG